MTPSALQPLERRLLAAATGLTRVQRIPELVERLRPAFALAPSPALAGLAVHDVERGLLVVHALEPDGPALPAAEVPAPAGEAARFAPGARRCLVQELAPRPADPFARSLAEKGAARLASAPLFFGERLLGTLFVGRRAGEVVAPGELEYLVELAKVVEPHVWNCFTDERFSRGDRRRDALRQLSGVINSSLDPQVVLHLARSAIGAIEGHRASWIGLVDDGGASWRRYDRPADYGDDAGEPDPRPLAGSLLAEVVGAGRTLESGDLARAVSCEDERELRAAGVRRYVAAPLRAGGQILGAFVFGSDDPHPPLRVDVWLIENVALQVALALHNAQHYVALQKLSARREQHNLYLREELQSEHVVVGMIGRAPAMRAVFERVGRVAATDSTVLITGPTGVGKELVARAIHEQSPRKDQPLVKLNCAAIPESMVESELFGHERGAFTSAVGRRIGRFELAHGGTLFLDEIGELSLPIQAKLLRVLQDGEFERVGGTKTLASSARIVAATNRDLSRALAAGTFRSDLYYRLNVFPIEVPPLDERREDVPLLAQAFAEQFARRMGKRFDGLEPASLERLCARAWPGNVRELRHVIERAVILCDGPQLVVEDERAPAGRPARPPAPASPGLSTLVEVEAQHIRDALARTSGVVEGPRGAAALLGLKGSTLRFRMKRLGIERPKRGSSATS